jgi:hypothetical protein
MVVDFTMFNQGKTVRCAISTAAMDDLEGKHEVKAEAGQTEVELLSPGGVIDLDGCGSGNGR